MEFIKSFILGIVEGITEWLPVSSTGHLILVNEFLNLKVSDNPIVNEDFISMFEVVIQLGAIMAVIVLFWNKLWPFSKKKSREENLSIWQTWFKVCVASVPAAAVGIVLDKVIEKMSGKDIDGWLYNGTTVALMLIIYGILFIIIEKKNANKTPTITDVSQISYKLAFLMGVFQMLAIIPGTSRSGSTILGSMLVGISRTAAAEFSFFLAIPTMLGASALKLLKFLLSGVSVTGTEIGVLLIGCIVSFLVSFRRLSRMSLPKTVSHRFHL